jgi:hypothetical protein
VPLRVDRQGVAADSGHRRGGSELANASSSPRTGAGKRALEILDAVVDALGREGLMVILDNHVSRADWCYAGTDGNEFWYSSQYPEARWIEDWKGIVGGVNYQSDLTGVHSRPIHLSVANRLVYAPHSYKWFADVAHGYDKFKEQVGRQWGDIITQGKPYTAPVWVSEFGTRVTWVSQSCTQDDANYSNVIQRCLREGDFDWSYWQLNGTQSDSLDHGSGNPAATANPTGNPRHLRTRHSAYPSSGWSNCAPC